VETRTVCFEPNFYSFDEIAQRLSTETFQVRCSSALRQRVAYLSLKPRPWVEIKRLLENGLHLTIRPDPKHPNIGSLECDKEVRKQEQYWQERFGKTLLDYLTYRKPNRYPNWGEVLSSLPKSIEERDLSNLYLQFQELAADLSDDGVDETDASLAARIARRLDKLDLHRLATTPDLLQWAQHQAKLPKHEFVQRFGIYFGGYFWDKDEHSKLNLRSAYWQKSFHTESRWLSYTKSIRQLQRSPR
jgi:hypothetical protein